MGDMTQTAFIGIDPGADGALAALLPGGAARVVPFGKDAYVAEVAALAGSVGLCVLEHVGAMPGQGVVSTFRFGENFGWIQGVLDSAGVPYELVRPQRWKREFGCTSDKNTSVEAARRLFPGVDLRRTPRCSKPHDGIAEALLMAEYARRKGAAR